MAGEEKFHAKTLKGLEGVLADELRELGAQRVTEQNRGVDFYGGHSLLYKVNLASRLALRVLWPIYRFEARDTDFLYRKVKQFPWDDYLGLKMSFAIDAVVYSPHFTNSHFVRQRVKDAIADRFREKTNLRPSVNRENPDLLINVHISETRVTISLDSSGSPLYRRGYRTGHFEAPLNEVLAAGMIRLSGWDGKTPFLDPMCGSGTLAIEAALIASRIPPGLFRENYGFEHWKNFDPELLEHVARSLPAEKQPEQPIMCSDVDPEAVELTRRSLKKLELDQVVKVEQRDIADIETMEGITVIMNPPYGERLKSEDLNALYGDIGSLIKHRFPGSDIWLLSSSREALKNVGLRPSSKTALLNGALDCTYVHYKSFKGTLKEHKRH